MAGVLAIDWIAVGSICAVITLALVAGRWVETRVRNFIAHRRGDSDKESRLWVTVFGRKGDDVYPAVPGLKDRVDALEGAVKVLLARTETNHGSSLKDQLDAICRKLDIPVLPISESQIVKEAEGATTE